MNVETRLNNVQDDLKTTTNNVSHLKYAVNIVEDNMSKVKVSVIPD